MTDRYVIVYRDGKQSSMIDRELADSALPALMRSGDIRKLPAYSIRIREKPQREFSEGFRDHVSNLRPARLDPLKALREVTGRTTIAGAEK